MDKNEALQRMNLLKEMEELLQEYQELTEEMLLELEQTAPINESKKKRRSWSSKQSKFAITDHATK